MNKRKEERVNMKVYKKPEIYIETFTLSKHIAACAFDMTNSTDKETCSAVGDSDFNVPNIVLYTESNNNCTEKDSDWTIYCYTNGTSGYNTFNS